ncbi:MAG TPA: lactonase family protein [Actinophytocola sp.]|uniref:lactonase family protein n=1 Tax=Actinophytocola sp. TaxID=1872138 RepID=UPI002DDD34CC|nr:lactonase family protein [Actinophytocola sp.]HEV2782610.1 lactonase family protein [Actinophytocola sp.]
MYIGSFSSLGDPPGRGLEVGEVDRRTGALTLTGAVEGVPDASWLALSLDRHTLYSTKELRPDGQVAALSIAEPARPVMLSTRPSRGAGPTHLSVHPSGRFLLTANYTDGSVAVHRLERDGSIGESTDLVRHTGAERAAHAHQVLTDPSGRWVLAVDLGADSVYVYRLDLNRGTLRQCRQVRLPAGAGPRHLAFHPHGRFAYILGELRSEITVAAWEPAAGRLTPGQVIPTVGPDAPGPSFPAEVAVSRDGRFVYASNRGENGIAMFTVHDSGRRLELAGSTPSGGDWPRHLTLSPDERWIYVANQQSHAITWLPRDPESGRLGAPAGSAPVNNVGVVLFR